MDNDHHTSGAAIAGDRSTESAEDGIWFWAEAPVPRTVRDFLTYQGAHYFNRLESQPGRSVAEKALPDYVRNILDMARGGFDVYGYPISREYAAGIIRAWLPHEQDRTMTAPRVDSNAPPS